MNENDFVPVSHALRVVAARRQSWFGKNPIPHTPRCWRHRGGI